MSYRGFIAKYFIPFDKARMFGFWLGDVKDSIMPEGEWSQLWTDFNRPD